MPFWIVSTALSDMTTAQTKAATPAAESTTPPDSGDVKILKTNRFGSVTPATARPLHLFDQKLPHPFDNQYPDAHYRVLCRVKCVCGENNGWEQP